MMRITIRHAEPEDTSGLIRLWQHFMQEQNSQYPDETPLASTSTEFSWRKRLHRQIQNRQVTVAVNEDCDNTENQLCGFLGYVTCREKDWIPPKIAYIVDLYVTPEARGSKAAPGMFCYLRHNLPEKFTHIWTNTSPYNTSMPVLFKRAGFLPLRDFHIPGLENDLYFRLSCAESSPQPAAS